MDTRERVRDIIREVSDDSGYYEATLPNKELDAFADDIMRIVDEERAELVKERDDAHGIAQACERRAGDAAKASTAYADDCESLREMLEDANEKLAWYQKRCDWYSGEIASISLGAENGKKWANTLLDDIRKITARAEAAEAREAALREALQDYMDQIGQGYKARGLPFGPSQKEAEAKARAAIAKATGK